MNPPCKIRSGQPGDLPQVLALDRRLIAFDTAFDPSLDPTWSDSEEARGFYHDRLSQREGVAFVAEAPDGSLAGFIVGTETTPESYRRPMRLAEAECLFIDPNHRGQGLGEALMQAFEDWARAQGIQRLGLTVSARNQRARSFYERLGYADYDVVLEKEISAWHP